MQGRSAWQLGDHIPEFVHGASATIGLWPHLLNGFDQTRCSIADHQPGRPESAPREITAKVQPIFIRLTLAETHSQKRTFAFGRVAPDHQHPFLLTTGPCGQVDGIEE